MALVIHQTDLQQDLQMQAALEALSGVNNIGGYTSFRALYTVDVNNYSDFVIIGDHIFH